MKSLLTAFTLLAATAVFADHHLETDSKDEEAGFISLFDGKSLDGWKVSENTGTFKVVDGAIVAEGVRAHAFYSGGVKDATFDDFELRMLVRTGPNSNGGIYVHTGYQENGWPAKGYEIQVNNSHSDWRKTGGLYGIADVKEEDNTCEDGEWMYYRIQVSGQTITVWVNDVQTAKYTEEKGAERPDGMSERFLLPDGGAIALQGHDPGSKIEYKDIRIKPMD